MGLKPSYKLVDTCAAEFEAATPYYYSTYETPFTQLASSAGPGQTAVTEDEIRLTERPKVVIIGGGPNRIGQGIEFDYCCVQAAFAMRELGLGIGDDQFQSRKPSAPITTRAICFSLSR